MKKLSLLAVKGFVLFLAISFCSPVVFAESSSRSSSRSSSSRSGGFFSSKSKSAPASKPSFKAPSGSTSRNSKSSTSIGNGVRTTPAAKSIQAKATPSNGLTSRNAASKTGIGSNGISAKKPIGTHAAKLSSADQKMVEAMKKNGVRVASRGEAKAALLKKDPSLASPKTVASKYNSYSTVPTSAPSYLPENTEYNGKAYVRVVWQDPISHSYSYRYRDPFGTVMDAYLIASIADNMTDYAMARQGIYYGGSNYAPVANSGQVAKIILVFMIFVIGIILISIFISSRR